MRTVTYPAHGWLGPNAHFELKWDDQGRDFATGWQGAIHAPGNGVCLAVLADRPFPNGFGPRYPVVRIDSGAWAGHEYYLGHTSARVGAGQRFTVGDVLSVADQGHNWAGTTGGWVELGEAFGGLPGPKAEHHWFDQLIKTPMVEHLPDLPMKYGDSGLRILGMSSQLRDCGYLRRPYWHFNRPVHGAVVAFQRHHKIPVFHGVVDDRTETALAHSSAVCKRTHRREV